MPEANLLGEPGRASAQFLKTLDDGRIAIAALAVASPAAASSSRPTTPRPATPSAGRSAATRRVFRCADLAVMVEARPG